MAAEWYKKAVSQDHPFAKTRSEEMGLIWIDYFNVLIVELVVISWIFGSKWYEVFSCKFN